MPDPRRRYDTLESALDHATRILADRFGNPDQQAAVALAQALYSLQERERFIERSERETAAELPYEA